MGVLYSTLYTFLRLWGMVVVLFRWSSLLFIVRSVFRFFSAHIETITYASDTLWECEEYKVSTVFQRPH
jgi:hypothetical protein